MKNIIAIFCTFFCIIIFPFISFAILPGSENYEMPLTTVDSGGDSLVSENFMASISIGQATPIGRGESENNIDYAGFQQPDEFYPTVITLSTFKAKQRGRKVLIKWKTASEIDNLGFNILRSDSENGTYAKVNADFIPAKKNAVSGAKYKFKDRGVTKGNSYWYKLEDIDKTTGSSVHDAVEVNVKGKAFKKKKHNKK